MAAAEHSWSTFLVRHELRHLPSLPRLSCPCPNNAGGVMIGYCVIIADVLVGSAPHFSGMLPTLLGRCVRRPVGSCCLALLSVGGRRALGVTS